MKLRTFFISYFLFLSILLGALGTISIYLTNHQTQSIREQSTIEFERIASTIEREVNSVYERGLGQVAIDSLLTSHINFHRNHNVIITIEPLESTIENQVSFTSALQTDAHAEYVFQIQNSVTTSWGDFLLTVTFDVTENIHELRAIQQILLHLFIFFSLVATIILYVILNKIFKPLEIVTESAQKIADGKYDDRIDIQGKNELATMANHFNQMAFEIKKRIQLLEEESERKQHFMDNLAHEIRTPLTSIYGYAEYMQKANLNEEEKIEVTSYVMADAMYMKKITNSMLELAALRNHIIKKEAIPIDELFNQIATTLEILFQEYQVELNIQPLDEIIMGQEDLIRSLILNLCVNAAKACESNKGCVVLSAEKEGEHLVLAVTDNGSGIAPEEIEKITEPFYQVDKARNRADGGIGLGLTLCKEIAQLHHARFVIESTLNIGTTVKVIFTTS